MPATMNKPQLFINIHYLEIGGAETSLIGLLQALDPDKVNVDLFINDHRGEMMQFIPEWVNVLPAVPAYTLIERPMKEVLQHRQTERLGLFRPPVRQTGTVQHSATMSML